MAAALPSAGSVQADPAPHFARDAYLEALEPPRLDLGVGGVLVGRILSADEWFRYEDRLAMAAGDQLTRQGLRDLIAEMTDLTFAPVTSRRWWFFRRATKVSTLLFRLPYAAQLEAFQSFTLAQATAQQGTTLRAMAAQAASRTQRPRSGTRSS